MLVIIVFWMNQSMSGMLSEAWHCGRSLDSGVGERPGINPNLPVRLRSCAHPGPSVCASVKGLHFVIQSSSASWMFLNDYFLSPHFTTKMIPLCPENRLIECSLCQRNKLLVLQ